MNRKCGLFLIESDAVSLWDVDEKMEIKVDSAGNLNVGKDASVSCEIHTHTHTCTHAHTHTHTHTQCSFVVW